MNKRSNLITPEVFNRPGVGGAVLKTLSLLINLENMARYAGLLLALAEGFGLRPRHFLPFGQKKAYYAVLAHFWPFFGVQ